MLAYWMPISDSSAAVIVVASTEEVSVSGTAAMDWSSLDQAFRSIQESAPKEVAAASEEPIRLIEDAGVLFREPARLSGSAKATELWAAGGEQGRVNGLDRRQANSAIRFHLHEADRAAGPFPAAFWRIAQPVERPAVNREVAGPTPVPPVRPAIGRPLFFRGELPSSIHCGLPVLALIQSPARPQGRRKESEQPQ